MPLAAAVLRRLSERTRHPHAADGLRLLSDVSPDRTIAPWTPQYGDPACIFLVESCGMKLAPQHRYTAGVAQEAGLACG
jgi:hypothetical protein